MVANLFGDGMADQSLPFDGLTADELRRRRGIKWRLHPSEVLPAWVAEMDFPLAPAVQDAIVTSVEIGDCGYGDPSALRRPVADWVDRMWGWTVDPVGIRPVPQVVTAMIAVLKAVTAPGDQVVIDVPAYPPFAQATSAAGRRPRLVPLTQDTTGYRLNLVEIEQAYVEGARVHLLCSPHNPTGAVFDAAQLADLAQLATRHDVIVLSDEIYAPLVLDSVHTPFPVVSDACHSVVFSSAGKTWNISALRAAFAIAGDARMAELLERAIGPQLMFQTGHLGVQATIAAFEHGQPWLDQVVATVRRNRRLLADLLPGRLRWTPPQAGYLAWLDCSAAELGPDPAEALLQRSRVAVTAGAPFEGPQADQHVRLNFGTGGPLLTEILHRIRRSLGDTSAPPPSRPSSPEPVQPQTTDDRKGNQP